MALQEPYNNAGLIMQGFGQLGQGLQQAAQDQQLNAPGDPLLDAYFDRLLKGEDPQKLAQEARQSGALELLKNYATNGPRQGQSPAGYVPDAGMVGNQPTLGAPGQFSPAGGPQGAPSPAAGGGLSGAAQAPVQQPNAQQTNIGSMTGMLRGQPVQGMQGRDAPVMNAQPMNAPTGGLSAGASWQPTAQPPRQPMGQPQTAGGASQGQQMPAHKLRSVREQQRLMAIAPTLEASRSREAVAKIKAEGENARAQLQSEAQAFIAVAKEKGLDERSMRTFALGLEGLDDKQQVAVLNAATKLLAAQTMAGATLGSAKIRTEGGQENEQLKNAQKAVAALRGFLGKATGADKYTSPDGTSLSISEAQQSLRDWEDKLRQLGGVPTGGGGADASPQAGGIITPKQPIPATPGKSAPVKAPAGKTSKAVSVHFKKSGKTYQVPEGEVDAAVKAGGEVVR